MAVQHLLERRRVLEVGAYFNVDTQREIGNRVYYFLMEILRIYFNQSNGRINQFQNLLILRRKKDESLLKRNADIVSFLELRFCEFFDQIIVSM